MRETVERQALIPGSKVSFIYEADAKGGKATCVTVEEMAEPVVVDEVPRELGTVKVRLAASAAPSALDTRLGLFKKSRRS